MSVQDKVNKLHTLLTEALAFQAQIIGEEPAALNKAAEPLPHVLDVLEFDLDRVLEKAERIVGQLRGIKVRLSGGKEETYAGSGS